MSAPAPADLTPQEELAILDVGSNSVRLVAYRLEGRAMTPFLNEKVLAGLGRDVGRTGQLPEAGVAAALAALRRFAALIDGLQIRAVVAVATEAVRRAADGAAFVAQVKRETGVALQVLSGVEEGRLSALGVLAGAHAPSGVVADLGGSSLELAALTDGAPEAAMSFSVGPLALMDGREFSAERVRARVDEALAAAPLPTTGGALHAVGGAFRALMRIEMRRVSHPLGVLHGYEIDRAAALEVASFVAGQSRKALEKLGDAAAKRADTLPYAAILLERLIQRGGFQRVRLSSYGLREGLIFERLDAMARAQDPLIASALAFGATTARARAFCAALDAWLAPVFEAKASPRERTLRAAACALADIGALLHPDQRAEVTFELVLRGPLAGVTHAERAFLAAAVHHRYTKGQPPEQAVLTALLSDKERRAAAALGAAMRLGADLSGRSEALLAETRLTMDHGVVLLCASKRPELLGESAQRRLEALAQLLGAPHRLGAMGRSGG